MAQKPNSLSERFLMYLHEERQLEVARLVEADKMRLEASKRIRKIDKQITEVKGAPYER